MTTNLTWNISGVDPADHIKLPWIKYMEATILSIVCVIGLLFNIQVMIIALLGAVNRTARQKLFLLFGLSLSDSFVCCLRGPCIVAMVLYRTGLLLDEYICAFWIFSFAFVFIAMITNMVIAVQRRMIVFAYQQFLRIFTSKRTLVFTVALWAGVAAILVTGYIILEVMGEIPPKGSSCHVIIARFQIDSILATIVRGVLALVLGILPICILCFCYVHIICQICRTGLLQLERVDESACYRRVMNISLGRLCLSIVGWVPYLLYVTIAPLVSSASFFASAHYLDFLVVLQAAVSPLITMQDAEFRDQANGTSKKRYWSIFWKSKQNSRKVSVPITSADMKTQGPLQDENIASISKP